MKMELIIMNMEVLAKLRMKNISIVKKINNNNGFSLTETLSTLILMSLVGIMITTGIATSINVYKDITQYNNAQLLLSNTITALHDELIYALPDSLPDSISDTNSITFEHVQNGKETIKFNDTNTNKGICVGYGEITSGTDEFYPLVAYQNSTDLYNNWTIAYSNKIFTISVYVYKSDNTELIKVENYKIKPLNG